MGIGWLLIVDMKNEGTIALFLKSSSHHRMLKTALKRCRTETLNQKPSITWRFPMKKQHLSTLTPMSPPFSSWMVETGLRNQCTGSGSFWWATLPTKKGSHDPEWSIWYVLVLGMVSRKSLPLVDAFWPKELLSSTALNFPFTHSHLFPKWEANILLKTMKSFSWYTQPNCLISLLRWRKLQIQRWRYFTGTWNKISNAFFMVTLSARGTFLVKDATAAAD